MEYILRDRKNYKLILLCMPIQLDLSISIQFVSICCIYFFFAFHINGLNIYKKITLMIVICVFFLQIKQGVSINYYHLRAVLGINSLKCLRKIYRLNESVFHIDQFDPLFLFFLENYVPYINGNKKNVFSNFQMNNKLNCKKFLKLTKISLPETFYLLVDIFFLCKQKCFFVQLGVVYAYAMH